MDVEFKVNCIDEIRSNRHHEGLLIKIRIQINDAEHLLDSVAGQLTGPEFNKWLMEFNRKCGES